MHACMVFGLHCVLSFHILLLLRRYFEKVSDSDMYSHYVHTVNALEPKSWATRVSSIQCVQLPHSVSYDRSHNYRIYTSYRIICAGS